MGWKPATKSYGARAWITGAVVFASEAEALEQAEIMRGRWALAKEVAALSTDDPVNARLVKGKIVFLSRKEMARANS